MRWNMFQATMIVTVLLALGTPSGTATDGEEPFVVEREWEGFISCSVHVILVGESGDPCDSMEPNADRELEFVVDEGIRSIVLTMEWDDELTTLSCFSAASALRIDVIHHETGLPYTKKDDISPIVATVGPETGDDEIELGNVVDETSILFRVQASAGWCGVSYQQPFTVEYDLYYWEPAPQ